MNCMTEESCTLSREDLRKILEAQNIKPVYLRIFNGYNASIPPIFSGIIRRESESVVDQYIQFPSDGVVIREPRVVSYEEVFLAPEGKYYLEFGDLSYLNGCFSIPLQDIIKCLDGANNDNLTVLNNGDINFNNEISLEGKSRYVYAGIFHASRNEMELMKALQEKLSN